MTTPFSLSPASLALLRRIKNDEGLQDSDWAAIPTLEEKAYLEAEQAIVQERYTAITEELAASCAPHVGEMLLTYRDLFLNPHAACKRAQALLSNHPAPAFEPAWITRFEFWLADAHHLIGEIEAGQKVLARALPRLESAGLFKAEALTVTALSEYLAGENASAADYHHQARAELAKNPDVFLTIFNASMALRVFLKECDPVGFEVFSHELDQALAKKEDRRYLLRQTGYRAMLMTIVGDRDEAKRLWVRADQLATQTTLAWERGQYGVLRGLVAALFDGTAAAEPYFERAERELAEAGFPGPYRAELDCARVLAHWVGQSAGTGLETLLLALQKGQASLLEKATHAPLGLQAHYRQADLALNHLLKGAPAQAPQGPCLVVSLITKLGRAEEMTRALSDFRLLPRFVRQLRRNSGSKESIASALQASIGLPVQLEGESLKVDSKLESHESRPDIRLVMELAETLIRHHELVAGTERARALGELATQLAHDIRSPIAALKAARISIAGEESELIRVAISRIQEIADDLLVANGSGRSPRTVGGTQSYTHSETLASALESLIREKRLEYSDRKDLQMKLKLADGLKLLGEGLEFQGSLAQFRRAVSNLINNAAEALGGGGEIECELGLAPNEKNVPEWELTIQDSGPGFDEALLNQPFLNPSCSSNSSSEIRSRRGGPALGLKQAREFVRESQGELYLENRRGGSGERLGARVRLRLPATLPSKLPAIKTEAACSGS